MKKHTFYIFIIALTLFLEYGCKKDDNHYCKTHFGCDSYDIDAYGIPRFINNDYIELSKIQRISKFRSGSGHDFSDDFESCRSMKHYFKPFDTLDWTTVKIYSPVNGKIIFLEQELPGSHIQIQCSEYPAFYIEIFHANFVGSFHVGDAVNANEYLGTHSSGGTTSDIAIGVHTPNDGPNNTWLNGLKLVSYFDVISDSLFQNYPARGISSRDSFVITKSARDADVLDCNSSWNSYPGAGNIPNWTLLN